jgi:hypothetical protein
VVRINVMKIMDMKGAMNKDILKMDTLETLRVITGIVIIIVVLMWTIIVK